MRKVNVLRSLVTEYGLGWTFFRGLYALKCKLLTVLPASERLFERPVQVRRSDLFAFDNEALRRFLRALPEGERNALIATADDAERGRILGFSSVTLDYGEPLDWQLNPVTGKRCDETKKWYRIPDFEAERGDIKLVWEASRFTHFHAFIRAYLLTGDARYYRAFSRQLADWLEKNPYSFGANYKCGQECTLRMLNALAACAVFRQDGLLTAQDEANATELVRRCTRKVRSNFFYAYRCIRNNHTLSEIAGLIAGAYCCEDARALRRAKALLNKVVLRQFSPDGGYVQNSVNYQRFALQMMECVRKMEEKTGALFSEKARARVAQSAWLLYQLQNDDGDLPNYGPNDGAHIFPLSACGYRDFRPVLNTVSALFGKGRLYPAGAWDEELLWFGGADAPIANAERRSSVFPEAGLYTLRGKRGYAVVCLKNHKTRPAHMDGLHLDVWRDGENLLCDSGTYSYAEERGKALARTAAHNTVKADGREQMETAGNFLICGWTRAEDISHGERRFCGTLRSRQGYAHRRIIEETDAGLCISDELTGAPGGKVLLHTPCACERTEDGALLLRDGRPVCRIRCNSPVVLEKAERSLYYYQMEEITRLSLAMIREKNMSRLEWTVEWLEGESTHD